MLGLYLYLLAFIQLKKEGSLIYIFVRFLFFSESYGNIFPYQTRIGTIP